MNNNSEKDLLRKDITKSLVLAAIFITFGNSLIHYIDTQPWILLSIASVTILASTDILDMKSTVDFIRHEDNHQNAIELNPLLPPNPSRKDLLEPVFLTTRVLSLGIAGLWPEAGFIISGAHLLATGLNQLQANYSRKHK